ncbi:MAG: Fic family protein [Streptococcaceae bacterium]|nr:Fic family protein [Streptococcaceae bacterium]
MSKKEYQSYEYIDPDAIYTYPNSDVLINKFGLTDAARAYEMEYESVLMRLLELEVRPIFVHSMKDILRVHAYIFQDIYEWAGQYRKVNISKQGNAFMAMQAFGSAETYMNLLISDFQKNANNREDIIIHLARILDNENYFHPFREGNGRTQREVIRVLGLEKDHRARINLDKNDEIYNLYMDGTVHGDVRKLELLFSKVLCRAKDFV